MNGMERLARAERDCVDLHQALANAIRRLRQANRLLLEHEMVEVHDLIDVFNRTSQPSADELDTPAARHAQIERARTPGGYAV